MNKADNKFAESDKKKTGILIWILLSGFLIPIMYGVSLIAVLFVHGAFGFTMNDWGTHLSNTLMQVAGGSVFGFLLGLLQMRLMRTPFHVSWNWVWALVIGFSVAEIIAGLIFWNIDVIRGTLTMVNTSNHVPEALIFSFAGLFTGLIQWKLLKKHFKRAGFWVAGSTLGMALYVLSATFGLTGLFLGSFVYAISTGLILQFVLKRID